MELCRWQELPALCFRPVVGCHSDGGWDVVHGGGERGFGDGGTEGSQVVRTLPGGGGGGVWMAGTEHGWLCQIAVPCYLSLLSLFFLHVH